MPDQPMHRGVFFAALLSATLPAAARAQEVKSIDPHVHAVVGTAPPLIRLEWGPMAGTLSFAVARREPPATTWTIMNGSLAPSSTSFEDGSVELGRAYEYMVTRIPSSSTLVRGTAYLIAGIDVPFRDDPGAVLVVVDSTMAGPLSDRLARLEEDLQRDGWETQRQEVAPTSTPASVRERVQAAAALLGGRLRAAILLGGVPRAFAGHINPDGHSDHVGAWPADGYYADLDGSWTDVLDLGGSGSFVNDAGDGKLDPSYYPSPLELGLGRVDTIGITAFAGMSATDLLGRYLDRNHAYRIGEAQVRPMGLVTDNFGYFGGEAFARVAWRDTAALYGTDPEVRPFFDALEDPAGGYAFAFGCGGGNPWSAGGVGTVTDFATRSPRALFMGLFGSYFGDWSYGNNLLRVAIMAPSSALAAIWFARPYAHLHGLGALRSFGEAFLAGANNPVGNYDSGFDRGMVHQALLGDPTLRMFTLRPPGELSATVAGGAVTLEWAASADASDGYHVYRRLAGQVGPESRLTAAPVSATSFVDAAAEAGASYVYRVVAVARLTTGSGTFFNHSLGVMTEASAAGSDGAPLLDEDAGPTGSDYDRTDADSALADGDWDAGPSDSGPEPDAGGDGAQDGAADTFGADDATYTVQSADAPYARPHASSAGCACGPAARDGSGAASLMLAALLTLFRRSCRRSSSNPSAIARASQPTLRSTRSSSRS